MTHQGSSARGEADLGSVAPPCPVTEDETLLVFSDVHLGSDVSDLGADVPKRSPAVDRDLARLVAHYRQVALPRGRWRIVIAGDFVDFLGMTITSRGAELSTELTDEERAHGLGNAADHARAKLSRVRERHAEVLTELGRSVAAGHALSIVVGNHDLEFHWRTVQEDFRAALFELSGTAEEREAFEARIEFSPWFFLRDGVAYIEHGHMYDPFCSNAHVMAPLSPADPRRVVRGFCDTLLRFVVRPTRGLRDHGHESMGVVDYLRFGLVLGVRGSMDAFVRFVRAVLEMFRLRREHFSETAKNLRAEHERRVAKLGVAVGIGRDRLLALLALQAPPITQSIHGILASVLLDKVALGMAAILSLLTLAIVGMFYGHALLGSVVVLVAWSLLHRHLSKLRTVDAGDRLRERAAQLAALFPVAFVVMGHTHTPVRAPAGAATYINLGSWAEEDDASGSARAARTHLVIQNDGTPTARFYRWDSERGAPVEDGG